MIDVTYTGPQPAKFQLRDGDGIAVEPGDSKTVDQASAADLLRMGCFELTKSKANKGKK